MTVWLYRYMCRAFVVGAVVVVDVAVVVVVVIVVVVVNVLFSLVAPI